MFLVAIKTAIVESLRAVWFTDQETNSTNPQLDDNDLPYPRRITVEYPEEEQEWPAVLVQVRPTIVEWTGISADEVIDAANWNPSIDYTTDVDPSPPTAPAYKSIRQGRFEANCMLEILATTSEERDRIWDNLVKLLLMGRKRTATNNFYETLANHDLVGVTVMEGSIDTIGDSIVPGTPWSEEEITYEASIAFRMTGVFYADEYTEDLVPLAAAQVFEYIAYDDQVEPSWRGGEVEDEQNVPPYESDGKGQWLDPYTD